MNTLNMKLRVFLYFVVLFNNLARNSINKAKPSNIYPDNVIKTRTAIGNNAKAIIVKSIVIL